MPNLGVVQAGEQRFTIADVPGLIPGASEGKGLGLEFLRHVERCSVLVHVIDCATLEPGRDPMTDLDVIEAELAQYVPDETLGGRPLAERTRMVVLNKADVPEARELAEMVKPDLEARGLEVFIVSAVARTGLRELTFAMARHVDRGPGRDRSRSSTRRGSSCAPRPSTTAASSSSARTPPTARSSASSASAPPAGSARPTSPTTRPSATSPTGWPGPASRRRCSRPVPSPAPPCSSAATTTPSSSTGSRPCPPAPSCSAGPRGTDVRLDDRHRPTRDEKRADYADRRAARTAAREELAAERRAGHWAVAAEDDEVARQPSG